MKKYFELQYKMTNRRLNDAGLNPLLSYLILTFVFVQVSIALFEKTHFAEYIYLFFALTLIAKLSETRRTEFLKLCFGSLRLNKIRIAENLICSLPFLSFLIYKQLFAVAGLLFVLTVIIAFANFRTSLNFTIWTPFSKRPFEFPTGFRTTFHLFFIAYALTMIAVSVNNFNLGIFSMLLVFGTTANYHFKPENEYFVWTYNLKPREFLLGKIRTALLLSSLLALPAMIVLSTYFYQSIDLVLIFFVLGWAILISVILAKYSAYPNEIGISQGVLLALCIWLPPLLVILIPYLFKQSENRLKNLLK